MWQNSMAKLREWMLAQETFTNIADIIIDRLLAWRTNSSPSVPVSRFAGLAEAVRQQDKLGWQNLLEGFPAVGWAEVQGAYYTWNGSKRSGKRWTVELLMKLSDVAWDQWQHWNGIVHDKEKGI